MHSPSAKDKRKNTSKKVKLSNVTASYDRERKSSYTRSFSAHSKRKHNRAISQDAYEDPLRVRTKSQDLRSKESPTINVSSTPALFLHSGGNLIEGQEETLKEIHYWLSTELSQYSNFVPSLDFNSFATGEPFLALLHKYDHSIIDLATFDRSDRIRTLSTAFALAEQHIGLPNILDPFILTTEILRLNTFAQRQLLLYLVLWREKTIIEEDSIQLVKGDLQKLINLTEDCSYNVEVLGSEVDTQILKLKGEIRNTDKERYFDEESAVLYDQLLSNAMENITALEAKQQLLLRQNRLLRDKLNTIHDCKSLEENSRKKTEQQLLLEERIKAIGEVLMDRGLTNFVNQT